MLIQVPHKFEKNVYPACFRQDKTDFCASHLCRPGWGTGNIIHCKTGLIETKQSLRWTWVSLDLNKCVEKKKFSPLFPLILQLSEFSVMIT